MARRLHVQQLHAGDVALTRDQAHHLWKVLRLVEGETVELFDDAGQTATGTVHHEGSADASVRVGPVTAPASRALLLTIAAAIPKGERADWMIEKLSELGVDTFIPLAAARSVVVPEGRNKHERWARIARESAEQSRRIGTMRIEEIVPVDSAIKRFNGLSWVCSMEENVTLIELAAQTFLPRWRFSLVPKGDGRKKNERHLRRPESCQSD